MPVFAVHHPHLVLGFPKFPSGSSANPPFLSILSPNTPPHSSPLVPAPSLHSVSWLSSSTDSNILGGFPHSRKCERFRRERRLRIKGGFHLSAQFRGHTKEEVCAETDSSDGRKVFSGSRDSAVVSSSYRHLEKKQVERDAANIPVSQDVERIVTNCSKAWGEAGEGEADMRGSSLANPSYIQLKGDEFSNCERKIPKTMLAKLGQGFNPAGIVFTLKVIFKEPQAALPQISVPDITWIDWKALKESGFQGIVFDKDNTLTAPYVQALWPSLRSSLEDCKTAFNGRVALLSNSAGLYQYDPDGMEAKAVEDMLGIPVIRHGSKKPAGSAEDVKTYFGCDLSLLVMVGDRHFTDIAYGNRNGLLTIITQPLTLVGEPFIVRQVRKLEGTLVQRWYRKGFLPNNHRLVSNKSEFVKDPARC